jgi:hypothetical protein
VRALAARTWPSSWTVARHRRWHRVGRIIWTAWAVILLVVALALAVAALAVSPVWWLAGNALAVLLVVAGWTPPAVFDPTTVDSTRALFGDDIEHQRHHDIEHQRHHHGRTHPTPSPAARPVPPPPEPPSLEERQVAAAEANAVALNRLALVEATRPAPAPILTQWTSERRAGSTAKRAGLCQGVLYVVFFGLILVGAVVADHDPTTTPNPFISGEPTP